VITFQPSDLPDVRLAREFASLREAREFFGLPTGSEFDRRRQEGEALRLRAEGLTTAAIAARLGVSERTVRHRLAAAKRRVP
jgi:DNA-binding NarL/FixJ family response regulator